MKHDLRMAARRHREEETRTPQSCEGSASENGSRSARLPFSCGSMTMPLGTGREVRGLSRESCTSKEGKVLRWHVDGQSAAAA